jgi:hypothetical protein
MRAISGGGGSCSTTTSSSARTKTGTSVYNWKTDHYVVSATTSARTFSDDSGFNNKQTRKQEQFLRNAIPRPNNTTHEQRRYGDTAQEEAAPFILSDADATNKNETPQDHLVLASAGTLFPPRPTTTLSAAIKDTTALLPLDKRRRTRRVKILEDEISSIKFEESLLSSSSLMTNRRGGMNGLEMPGAKKMTMMTEKLSTNARNIDTNFHKERSSLTRLTLASSSMKKESIYVSAARKDRIMTVAEQDEEASKPADKKQDTRIGTRRYSIRSSSSSPSHRRRSESIDRLYKLGKEKIRSTLPMNARDLERMNAEKLHRLASSPMRTRPERVDRLYSLGKEKNRSRLPMPTKKEQEIMSAESKRLHMLARSALKKTTNQQHQLERIDRLYEIGKDKIRSSLQVSSTTPQSKGKKIIYCKYSSRIDLIWIGCVD